MIEAFQVLSIVGKIELFWWQKFRSFSLTDQLLLLDEEEFLQKQFLLQQTSVFSGVEVVNVVAKNGLVSGKGRDDNQSNGDDQECLQGLIENST